MTNEYVYKYGYKAVEAYKRSLRLAENRSQSYSPNHIPYKQNRQRKYSLTSGHTLKRAVSQCKIQNNHGKSSKSLKAKGKYKEDNNKQKTSRSVLYGQSILTRYLKIGIGHNFNQLHGNGNKKKLLLSYVNTPNHLTPNKTGICNKSKHPNYYGEKMINVFVESNKHQGKRMDNQLNTKGYEMSHNSMLVQYRCVQEAESPSTKKKTNIQNPQKSRQKRTLDELIYSVIGLVYEYQNKDRKNSTLIKYKLRYLRLFVQTRYSKYRNVRYKIIAIERIIRESASTSFKNIPYHSCKVGQADTYAQDRVLVLYSYLAQYKYKYLSLLRIIENFGAMRRSYCSGTSYDKLNKDSSEEDDDN